MYYYNVIMMTCTKFEFIWLSWILHFSFKPLPLNFKKGFYFIEGRFAGRCQCFLLRQLGNPDCHLYSRATTTCPTEDGRKKKRPLTPLNWRLMQTHSSTRTRRLKGRQVGFRVLLFLSQVLMEVWIYLAGDEELEVPLPSQLMPVCF